jgi:predicted GIY-YIG superfamily endonuclease
MNYEFMSPEEALAAQKALKHMTKYEKLVFLDELTTKRSQT